MAINNSLHPTVNIVVNHSLDQADGQWYTKKGKNDIGEKAIILFQKKELSPGMKLALMFGTVKKNAEFIEVRFAKSNLPNNIIKNIRKEIPNKDLNKNNVMKFDSNGNLAGANNHIALKITIKTKEYENKKNEFINNAYRDLDQKWTLKPGLYDRKSRKIESLKIGAAFDYLNGRENKTSEKDLKNIIQQLENLKINKTAVNGEYVDTIEKIVTKLAEEKNISEIKDVVQSLGNPNTDDLSRGLDKFK